jgi:hypothetical protein
VRAFHRREIQDGEAFGGGQAFETSTQRRNPSRWKPGYALPDGGIAPDHSSISHEPRQGRTKNASHNFSWMERLAVIAPSRCTPSHDRPDWLTSPHKWSDGSSDCQGSS